MAQRSASAAQHEQRSRPSCRPPRLAARWSSGEQGQPTPQSEVATTMPRVHWTAGELQKRTQQAPGESQGAVAATDHDCCWWSAAAPAQPVHACGPRRPPAPGATSPHPHPRHAHTHETKEGLGFLQIKKMVNFAKGTIFIQSEPNKGSTISIEIKIKNNEEIN